MQAIDILPFDFQGASVRVLMIDNVAHWVATDVSNILGYAHCPHMVRMLEPHQKGVHKVDTLGGEQELLVITEGGLFRCIMRSKKPEAKNFCIWVEDVVLPSIRRSGRFDIAESDDVPALATNDPMDSVERVRTALQVVREARITFGNMAARRAWVLTGLPDVSPLAEGASHLHYLDAKAQAVARWFAERIEMVTGTRENATALYMDFSRWCDEANEESVTIKRFGNVMTELGIDKIHSNGCYYLGVRLKP